MRRALLLVVLGLAVAAGPAAAVRLDADGRGQALIFPYYRAEAGSAFGLFTYLTIFNHDSRPKALRVHVREGRRGRLLLAFNLFLAVDDGWSAAVGPTMGDAARVSLWTRDVSCHSPSASPFPEYDLVAPLAGFQDGAGSDAQRAGEGWIEVFEMATLVGASAQAASKTPARVPRDCAALQATLPAADLQAPTGGLSGTLSILDVSSGYDVTARAVALADLASRPHYRHAAETHPGFEADEIDRASLIVAGGKEYRLQWGYGRDAVASVLTRRTLLNEFVRDAETASASEWIVTRPFARGACEPFEARRYDREGQGSPAAAGGELCHAATVGVIDVAGAPSKLFAARNLASGGAWAPGSMANGWMRLQLGASASSSTLTSLPDSKAYDLATGVVASGAFRVVGAPVVGFATRSFTNGAIRCTTGTCLGNFGGSFPHRYETQVVPAP